MTTNNRVTGTISQTTHVRAQFDVEVTIDTPVLTPTVLNNVVTTSQVVTNSQDSMVNIFGGGRAIRIRVDTTIVMHEAISNFVSNGDGTVIGQVVDQFGFILEGDVV